MATPNAATVTDSALAANTTYSYSAFTTDAEGRTSAAATTATTTDPGPAEVPPSPPDPALADQLTPRAQAGFTGLPGSLLPAGAQPEAGLYPVPSTCDPTEKPGVRRFYDLFHAAYPVGRFGGITRLCALGGEGEHKEGRALDWMIDSATPSGRQQGDNIVGWLAADNGRMARSLGVEYLIWRDMMWRAYDGGMGPQYKWTQYGGCMTAAKQSTDFRTTCHRDHIHLSFTWDGAFARTSFWTGAVLADSDFGTCRAVAGESSAIHGSARGTTTACPQAPRQPWWNAAVGGKRLVLGALDAGSFKELLARATGTPATAGAVLDVATKSQILAWQSTHDLVPSGVADLSTWASLRTALGEQLPLPPQR